MGFYYTMRMLYHKEVYWPQVNIERRVIRPIPTNHARAQAQAKGFELPTAFVQKEDSIFEIEISNNRVVKYAIRLEYDENRDISLVISRDYAIITAWLNHKQDKHKTLDKGKYHGK